MISTTSEGAGDFLKLEIDSTLLRNDDAIHTRHTTSNIICRRPDSRTSSRVTQYAFLGQGVYDYCVEVAWTPHIFRLAWKEDRMRSFQRSIFVIASRIDGVSSRAFDVWFLQSAGFASLSRAFTPLTSCEVVAGLDLFTQQIQSQISEQPMVGGLGAEMLESARWTGPWGGICAARSRRGHRSEALQGAVNGVRNMTSTAQGAQRGPPR